MRVVQVLGGIEDGGLEKHTIELAHSLKERGVDVSVIAHAKFRDDFDGVNFIECDLSRSRNNPLILFKLYKILKTENFDIIHTQANKATDMVVKLKSLLNSKVVSTLHSYKRDIRSFKKADFVITVSDRIGEKLKTRKKITIYNGIDTDIDGIEEIDLHKKFNIPKEKFIVSAIGRFAKAKRFDLLINAMDIVKKNIHLVLVGDGTEDIKKMAKEHRNITLTGYLDNMQTKEILKSSKLCIISSAKEGFSYVFAEALMLNTPLVSTDVADIKRFIPSKFITKLDAKDIADKIESFYKNYRENLALYSDAFEVAKVKFSITNMTDSVIRTYKKVIDEL